VSAPAPTSAEGLIGRSVTVEAPATIANLGAGYDCLGLAVDLRLRVTVAAASASPGVPSVELDVDGEGAGELAANRSNRFVVARVAGLAELGFDGLDGVGWKMAMANAIPLERGLGSSAAATVAGLVAASAIGGRELGLSTQLRLAARIEGQPDNVAPGLQGGLVASIALDDRVEAVRLDPPPGLQVVAWIPERKLPTSEMRRVLPDAVPRADAVANLAHVAVGVAGLASGRLDVLSLLTQDRLHEPYRAAVYPELPELVAAARQAGAIGACLAGAGSTVVAFVDRADATAAERVGAAFQTAGTRLDQPGRLQALSPTASGAHVASH
jgi:homoserine kinase